MAVAMISSYVLLSKINQQINLLLESQNKQVQPIIDLVIRRAKTAIFLIHKSVELTEAQALDALRNKTADEDLVEKYWRTVHESAEKLQKLKSLRDLAVLARITDASSQIEINDSEAELLF